MVIEDGEEDGKEPFRDEESQKKCIAKIGKFYCVLVSFEVRQMKSNVISGVFKLLWLGIVYNKRRTQLQNCHIFRPPKILPLKLLLN